MDIKIFVDTDDDIRLCVACANTRERGRSLDSVLGQYDDRSAHAPGICPPFPTARRCHHSAGRTQPRGDSNGRGWTSTFWIPTARTAEWTLTRYAMHSQNASAGFGESQSMPPCWFHYSGGSEPHLLLTAVRIPYQPTRGRLHSPVAAQKAGRGPNRYGAPEAEGGLSRELVDVLGLSTISRRLPVTHVTPIIGVVRELLSWCQSQVKLHGSSKSVAFYRTRALVQALGFRGDTSPGLLPRL